MAKRNETVMEAVDDSVVPVGATAIAEAVNENGAGGGESTSEPSVPALLLIASDAGLLAYAEWENMPERERGNRIFQLLPEDINADHGMNGRRKRRSAKDSEVKELAGSIERQGRVIEPVIGFFDPETHAPILGVGFGRYEAVKLINLTRDNVEDKIFLPIIFLDIDAAGAFVLNVAENLKRQNLNAMDIADDIQRMGAQHGWNQRQIAEAMGLPESSVTGYKKLLKFPDFVQAAITDNLLTTRSALELTALMKEPDKFEKIANGLIASAREGSKPITSGAVRKAVKKSSGEGAVSTQMTSKEFKDAIEGCTGPGENMRVSAVCSIMMALYTGKSFNSSGKVTANNLSKKLDAAVALPLKGSKAA